MSHYKNLISVGMAIRSFLLESAAQRDVFVVDKITSSVKPKTTACKRLE